MNTGQKIKVLTTMSGIQRLLLTALVLMGLFSTFGAASELKVTKIFSDNMVLQRDIPEPVWGWAEPGEKVTVQFSGQEKSAIAGPDGKWMVRLDPLVASAEPEKLTVTGKSGQQEFTNVLVGDVWLCAGQSNMTLTFRDVPQEAASVECSTQIRFMTADNAVVPIPQDEISPYNNWVICDADHLSGVCRVGYYFSLKLWRELRIPIGLMNVAMGGSAIEAWLPPESFAAHTNWKDGNLAEMERIQKVYREYKNYTNEEKERLFTDYFKTSYGAWSKCLLEDGKFSPEGYESIFHHMRMTQAACLYNHAIRQLIPLGIKGVIWYQGETNYSDKQYAEKQQSMIETWRQLWGEGDFPFYTVQIAPYIGGADRIPGFWLQQYSAVKNTKNSGIISTVDISSDNQGQHPENKRDVGLRLALLALKDTYGRKDIVASGPTYKSMEIKDGQILVLFDNPGSGLTTKDGKAPDSFEVAGEDEHFYPATAVITGNTVEVSSPEVKAPLNVRFAWSDVANPNLRNKEGLPAFPFNTAEPYFKQRSTATMHLSMTGVGAEADKSEGTEVQKPVFSADGRISSGAKSIWQKPDYGRLTMCIDNDAICNFYELFNFGKSDISALLFMNKKEEVVGNSAVYDADVRDAISNSDKIGTYNLSLSLLDSGLIKVESRCSLTNPALQKSRHFTLDVPSYMKLYGEYSKDGKKVLFDEKSPVSFSGDDLKGATIKFFPDLPERSFSILPDKCSEIKIYPLIINLFVNTGDTFSFLLDIRGQKTAQASSELSPNGIDFWEVDKLHLPDYGACKNLVMNPSFEAGLRYWGYPLFGEGTIPLKYQHFYELDDKEAHSGSHSLRIKTLPIRCPLPLGFFTVPYIAGEQYTLSFYAKGSCDKKLQVSLWGRQLKSGNWGDALYKRIFVVDKEWKRYSTPIIADDRFGGIYFRAQAVSGEQEESVWLDDIQLEKGDMTDFASQPVAAQMVSSARGNFLEFGQKPDFKLLIQSQPDSEGTVSLSVEDFFFKKIFAKTYPFKTDARGKSTITLDQLSDQISKDKIRGVFGVSSVFKIAGVDRPFKDYFRFSVMNFLDNTQRNKNLFTVFYVNSLEARGPDMERMLARERATGFGSFSCDLDRWGSDLDYSLDKERMQLIQKYGIESMGRIVIQFDLNHGQIVEDNGKFKMTDILNRINPSDKELAEFEDICAVKARNRPWNKIWFFSAECNPGCMPLEAHPDAFAKFLLATLRGIKRGNPDAKVLITGGPWNMAPEQGTKWVERYIQDTKRIDPNARFDGAAAHHYRDFPENPDLDSDIAEFLKMLDRNGHGDWPFYIIEGGGYMPFNIPQEGISPCICLSTVWYFGPLSYHIGRAERIASAFSARNWLIALKYQDRVACMQDFMTPSRYMDLDFTPRPYDKMPNTLGRLLGNASFFKDIRFAPYVRCYVFKEDKSGAPIAAIWGYKESVDRWKEEPPLYKFAFGAQNPKFIDLMENEVSYPKDSDGRIALPMSPFPMFIKGKPGTEEQLCEAIAAAVPAVGPMSGVEVAAFPTAEGPVTIMDADFHNGAMTATAAGLWYNTPDAIPAGWMETAQYMNTTATVFAICGSTAEAVNNTGELVRAGHQYTVSADLGGGDGVDATVRVYATQNSDGTGTKVLLASVHRVGLTGDGYTLFHVSGTPGSLVPANLDGYYVQVTIGGPYVDHTIAGYYDNIVVTYKY